MPTQYIGLKELASRIGLKGICTLKNEHLKAHPQLPEFWERVTEMCKSFYMRSNEEIRRAEDIHALASDLFDTYGPHLWKRPANHGGRPWLYAPGEAWAQCTPYARDLFYDNDDDREFLRTTVTELITEKILKHHKTHYRQSLRHSSEASFAPEVDVASSSLQCFDPTTAGHSDANWLNDQGVWLGSYDEEKESVNGATFDEVTEKYFDDTTGGTSSYGVEPVVFDDMPAEPEMVMQCKACAVKGHVGLLKAEAWGFEWTENDTETRMTKNVWTYPCMLDGRKVFALLKRVPLAEQTRLDPASMSPLWQFWLIDGGYTKNTFLVQVTHPAATTTVPIRNTRSSVEGQQKLGGKQPGRGQYARKSAPMGGFKRPRESRSPNSAERLFERIRAAGSDDSSSVPAQRMKSLPSRGPAHRASSWDSMYDVTPRPEREVTTAANTMAMRAPPLPARATGTHPESSNYASSRRANASLSPRRASATRPLMGESSAQTTAAESEQDQPALAQPSSALPAAAVPALTTIAAAPQAGFDLWINCPGTADVYKVVHATDSLSVQELFAALQRKLNRILEGKEIVSISVKLPPMRAQICIENDDAEEWATVVRIVKGAGLEVVYGAVEAQE